MDDFLPRYGLPWFSLKLIEWQTGVFQYSRRRCWGGQDPWQNGSVSVNEQGGDRVWDPAWILSTSAGVFVLPPLQPCRTALSQPGSVTKNYAKVTYAWSSIRRDPDVRWMQCLILAPFAPSPSIAVRHMIRIRHTQKLGWSRQDIIPSVYGKSGYRCLGTELNLSQTPWKPRISLDILEPERKSARRHPSKNVFYINLWIHICTCLRRASFYWIQNNLKNDTPTKVQTESSAP